MTTYREFHRAHRRPRGLLAEQPARHWHKPHAEVLDYRRPPFARCSSAEKPTSVTTRSIGTWLRAAIRGALVYISTETGEERSFSYRELHLEVQRGRR